MTYAVLDHGLRLLSLGTGDLNEVIAFVAGLPQALVAISAPQRPNQGLMDRPEVRERLTPPPRPGRWTNFRLAEYQMRQHRISCPQTAAREKDCPNWMQMGFTLYHRLEGLGFRPYPEESPLQWIEVYPHAGFSVLLGQKPFPKTTLEGRIQRQLVLYDENLNILDPMRFFEEITRHRLLTGRLPYEGIYESRQLDALISAYIAWLTGNHPGRVTFLGDEQEGQVVLPAVELKQRY
jgi:hypothetical protein